MDKATDWKKFVALINAADENVDSNYKPRSETALALAFEALRQYQLIDVARAIHRLMRESPYKIKPADIVRVIGGTPSDRSALAWQTFKRALFEHGSFDSVAFGDAAAHYAIMRMGGWERVAKELEILDDRELEFRSKTWRQIYERGLEVASFDDVPGREKVPRYLWGECERNNREGGWSLDATPIHEIGTGRTLDRQRHKDEIAALENPDSQRPELAGEVKALPKILEVMTDERERDTYRDTWRSYPEAEGSA